MPDDGLEVVRHQPPGQQVRLGERPPHLRRRMRQELVHLDRGPLTTHVLPCPVSYQAEIGEGEAEIGEGEGDGARHRDSPDGLGRRSPDVVPKARRAREEHPGGAVT
ncbi:hypothetical protein ACQEU6_36410 [Spirillospora sp. CA-108201]